MGDRSTVDDVLLIHRGTMSAWSWAIPTLKRDASNDLFLQGRVFPSEETSIPGREIVTTATRQRWGVRPPRARPAASRQGLDRAVGAAGQEQTRGTPPRCQSDVARKGHQTHSSIRRQRACGRNLSSIWSPSGSPSLQERRVINALAEGMRCPARESDPTATPSSASHTRGSASGIQLMPLNPSSTFRGRYGWSNDVELEAVAWRGLEGKNKARNDLPKEANVISCNYARGGF
jgi:hypothetical protein